MITLGVSVYPEQETLEEIDAYLSLASRYGFTKVFTSMFSVPGTKEEVFQYFKDFSMIAHKYQMRVSGDCNTEFFKKMGASEENLTIFKEMGIDAIRMDFCYMDERDVTLINNKEGIQIELSAAFVNAIELAISNGADTSNFIACHNFYPERYTGADIETIVKVNAALQEQGVKCAMFISSNVEDAHGPWPVRNGLPTLEDHRWIPSHLQLQHLIALGNVDEVLFGNAFADEKEMMQIQRIMQAAYVHIKLPGEMSMLEKWLPSGDITRIPFHIHLEEGTSELEKRIVCDFQSHSASEYTYYMIRSRWTRIVYRNNSIPLRPTHQKTYKRGDVVIVNDELSYYRGEVQIVKKEMKVDGQRNLIGHIPEEELFLLDYIKSGDAFCFII